MTYEELIAEILSFAKKQKLSDPNGEYAINVNSLTRHFSSNFPQVDKRSIAEVIEEIDARGWLLENDANKLVFDPATFQ